MSKVDILSFNEDFNIESFFDWLFEQDRFMEYLDILDEMVETLVMFRLRGGASACW